MVELALNGWHCEGIDASPDVLQKAKRYVEEVQYFSGQPLPVKFQEGDFVHHQSVSTYDLVFHVGVIEHFLDEAERAHVLQKMWAATKSGGYTVSVVPSGTHPLREKMKRLHLGGYLVPEIDYTDERMQNELQMLTGATCTVLPHNIFGYLLIDSGPWWLRAAKRIYYYAFQLVPVKWLPRVFAFRHAGTLIGIAKKPVSA